MLNQMLPSTLIKKSIISIECLRLTNKQTNKNVKIERDAQIVLKIQIAHTFASPFISFSANQYIIIFDLNEIDSESLLSHEIA